MVPQTTIPTTVPFVPTIHQQSLVDKGLLLEGNLTADHTWHPIQISHQNRSLVRTSTATHAAAQIVNSPTAVSTVEPTMQSKTVPNTIGLSTPTKPQPWTPIRPFILECEVSDHPNKAFVRQLLHDLQHGCMIDYNKPQFANLAKNAYQQPEVIETVLKKECEAGQTLGPFSTLPLSNFRTSGLGLVPKHDGGWRVIYHLSAPIGLSIMIQAHIHYLMFSRRCLCFC